MEQQGSVHPLRWKINKTYSSWCVLVSFVGWINNWQFGCWKTSIHTRYVLWNRNNGNSILVEHIFFFSQMFSNDELAEMLQERPASTPLWTIIVTLFVKKNSGETVIEKETGRWQSLFITFFFCIFSYFPPESRNIQPFCIIPIRFHVHSGRQYFIIHVSNKK